MVFRHALLFLQSQICVDIDDETMCVLCVAILTLKKAAEARNQWTMSIATLQIHLIRIRCSFVHEAIFSYLEWHNEWFFCMDKINCVHITDVRRQLKIFGTFAQPNPKIQPNSMDQNRFVLSQRRLNWTS